MKVKRGARRIAAASLLALAACMAPPPPPAAKIQFSAPQDPAVDQEPPPQAAPAEASREQYSARRSVEVPLDRDRLSGRRGAELWVTSDGGKTWTNQGEVDAGRETAPFLAPRDGRYGFLVVPVSADGRRETTPAPGAAPERGVVVDTSRPVVEVLSPNGGESFGAGRSTLVRWAAEDANVAPAGVSIEVSVEGGEWIPVARDLANTGQYHWDIGDATSARMRLRVVVRDLAGNVGMDATDGEFVVDGLGPDVRIVGPKAAHRVPVDLEWTGGDLGGSGLKRVTLYVTRDDGRTWKRHGEDADLKSPYPFTDLDGVIGMRLVAEDRMGNAAAPPAPGTPPRHTLVLDRTKPEVKLLSPVAGGYHAAVPIDVRWTAKDNMRLPETGISLFWTGDGGKTWNEIASGLKNDGFHAWTPPGAGPAFRVKVAATDAAGNRAEAVSGRFGVDEAVPQARAVAPTGSNANTVQVHYEILNLGAAPIAQVTLYYRPQGAKEWTKVGDDPDRRSPVTFAKADGTYDLAVVCATASGLKSEYRQKPPDETTPAQLTLTVDATPPILQLESFTGGGYVRGGTLMDVVWKLAEASPAADGLSILHSPDGGANWALVADGLDPEKGSHRWNVPKSYGARHLLKLIARDRFGNTGSVKSEKPFTIDSDLPKAVPVEAPAPIVRSQRLSVPFKASDETSGIVHVDLYGRRLQGGPAYKRLSRIESAAGTIACDVPEEGAWGFLLVATDGAGHPSVDVATAGAPQFEVAFDRTEPEIALKSFTLENNRRTWLNDNWEIEWEAKDAFTPAGRLVVRIEYSHDGGQTWFQAAPRHPAGTGRFGMRETLVAGKRYLVRVVAVDEAGNEAEAQSQGFDPADLPAPRLSLRGLDDGRQYVAGGLVTVYWSASDPGIRQASLELSGDGGRTWPHFADLHTRSLRIRLPEAVGRYHLRGVARDHQGRRIISRIIGFSTIAGADQVKFVTHRTARASTRVPVLIEPKRLLDTAKRLEMEIFMEGEWRKLGDPRDQERSFLAPAVPGEYAVRIAVTAADGREYASEEKVLKVTAASEVRLGLLNFQNGGIVAGGAWLPLMLEGDADPASLIVEFSEKGGAGETWQRVPAARLRVQEGSLFWRVPAVTGDACRVRLLAPGGERAESAKDFAIDSRAPAAVVTGPAGPSKAPVALDVDLTPSLAPVRSVKLYVTRNGGRSWALHKAYAQPGEIDFSAPPGSYGVYATAGNALGMEGEAPVPGTKPQQTVRIAGGKVAEAAGPSRPGELMTKLPAVLKGGTVQPLQWRFDGEGKVTILLEVDGKRSEIGVGLPAAGRLDWTIQRMDAKGCRLILRQGDREVAAGPFSLDSTPPAIEGVEVVIPKR